MTLQDLYVAACDTPSDINEHLPDLAGLAAECGVVVELGVRTGVSTTALLYGLSKSESRSLRWLHSYDINDCFNQRLASAIADQKLAWKFHQSNSLTAVIPACDLLFIDTWHVARQLYAELREHHEKVRRWIVLHDTQTFGVHGEDGGQGLNIAVDEFLREYPDWHIVEVKTNNNGLTILECH